MVNHSVKKHQDSTTSTCTSEQTTPTPYVAASPATDFYIPTPTYNGWLSKQGFKWRKKWQVRYVELHGSSITYYKDQLKCSFRKTRVIPPNATVAITGALSFSIRIATIGDYSIWHFRCETVSEKDIWLSKLRTVITYSSLVNRFQVGNIIGTGAYGSVHTLVDTKRGAFSKEAPCAVKVIPMRNKNMIQNELTILRKVTALNHRNIITSKGAYAYKEKIHMMFKLCSGGELYQRVVSQGRFSEIKAAHIITQLAGALQALHGVSIAHLDIKPENVLYEIDTEESAINLIDFGLAMQLNSTGTRQLRPSSTPCGTVGYMAPEIITDRMYSTAADIFSLGVVLYILLSGYPPFYGKDNIEVMKRTAAGKYSYARKEWKYISQEGKDLIDTCLQVNPHDRSTINEVLSHPWITSGGRVVATIVG